MVDDGSTDLDTLGALTRAAAADPRVRLVRLEPPVGAAAAANAALGRARGEFVAFVPPGDHLEPLALLEVVDLLNRAPELDLLYTDEHEYDPATGRRVNPSLKPSWSPDLLRSTNYVGQLAVYRRAAASRSSAASGRSSPAHSTTTSSCARPRCTDRVGHVALAAVPHDEPGERPSPTPSMPAGGRSQPRSRTTRFPQLSRISTVAARTASATRSSTNRRSASRSRRSTGATSWPPPSRRSVSVRPTATSRSRSSTTRARTRRPSSTSTTTTVRCCATTRRSTTRG